MRTLEWNSYVATVSILTSGEGFVADWWVSKLDNGYPVVVGHLEVPVWGDDIVHAEQRAVYSSETIFEAFSMTWGGEGSLLSAAQEDVVDTHLDAHDKAIRALLDTSKMAGVAAAWRLVTGFRNASPARVISDMYSIPVRSVHDYIDQAREKGLLTRPGQGARLA